MKTLFFVLAVLGASGHILAGINTEWRKRSGKHGYAFGMNQRMIMWYMVIFSVLFVVGLIGAIVVK